MSTAISLLLLSLVALLIYRQYQLKSAIADLIDAAENQKPYILQHSARWVNTVQFDRLCQIYAHLREKSIQINQQELSHLRQIESTLKNLTEAVIVLNCDHQLILVNPAAQNLFSIPLQHQQQPVEQYIRSAEFLEMLALVENGRRLDCKEVAVRTGKKVQHFEATGALIPEESREDLMVFVLHDITRLKELENLRKEFVANVSHELRTPLTIIKGFSDALVEDHLELSHEQRSHFLQKVQNNVNRLHLLLEDLLILSRLDRGKESLNLETVSLSQLIHQVVDDMQSRLDPSKETIAIELQHSQDRMPLDPIKISQVFHNILDNALRYAKGFDRISIKSDQSAVSTHIAIYDNGCGIPPKDIEHIFERFYRVDKGRSRELGGTGLGLSIVKHIVLLHGGSIAATSEEGQGTCIDITLPLQREAVPGESYLPS